MKSSNDNTLLFVGLFVLIVVIIALIVYYTSRPGETKTPDQTSDTTELKVENLTFERTLNPDTGVGDGVSGYTIEPYGVEYATGAAAYKKLSENVTFTMKWDNAPGFNGVAKGFKIEHFVKPEPTDTVPTPDPVKKQDIIKQKTESDDDTKDNISIIDFGVCRAKIVSVGEGDDAYSVIGQNSFKLYAVVKKNDATDVDWADVNTQKYVLLYDGRDELATAATALKISKDQLSATIGMAQPQTLKYTPAAPEDTSTKTVIDKTTYTVTNNATNLNFNGNGVYLTTISGSKGKDFHFTYEDGTYLRDDLTKGEVTATNGRTKFKFEVVDKDGSSGYIRVVDDEETDESKRKYLTSEGTALKLYTQTANKLTQTIFNGFKWTFNKRISKMIAFRDNKTVAFGTTVCISGDDAFIGDPESTVSGNIPISYQKAGCVHYYKRSKTGDWERKSILLSKTPGTNHMFGCSISVSGNYVAIGEEGGGASKSGAVHVFSRSDKNKSFLQSNPTFTLSGGGAVSGDRLGASVAIGGYGGSTIVAGVPGRNNATGAIRTYNRIKTSKNRWVDGLEDSQYANGKQGGAEFGASVDINEKASFIIVGAPKTNQGDKNNVGAIHIFRNTSDFRETPNTFGGDDARTTVEGVAMADSLFGAVVSISGDNAIVGVPGITNGLAMVYKYVGGETAWTEARVEGISTNYESNSMSNMIANVKPDSVSISGSTIVIGHSRTDTNTGGVTVVKNNGSDDQGPYWIKSQYITAPKKENGAKFGKSVSTDGDYIIIGEPSRKKKPKSGYENGTDIKGSFYITTA